MTHLKNKAVYLLFLSFVLFPCWAGAKNKAVSIELEGGKAQVSLLKGSASIVKKGMTKAQPLVQGDLLSGGDRITTGKNTRIELKLPDGSYLRYDEQTTFELTSADFDKKKNQRDISVRMILGKTWAKVARLFGGRGRFAISTRTAVAGVRGTVYRMNVDKDNSVTVKVYWGEVVVNSRPKDGTEVKPSKIMEPKKVSGPYPVPGPHPVSMEEWTFIVKALQQINIRPDGTVTKPFRFNIKDDLNDWVVWNQNRDKIIGEN